MTQKCPECGSDNVSYDARLGSYHCWGCLAEFAPSEGSDDGHAETPLRIFISYGHPEEEIVQRIKEYLEARGHEVWFDKAGHGESIDPLGIEPGDDWRESIASGAASSDVVIAFLSRHALRPGGVCLKEIDIAIAARGGNIKTVLLDPEGEMHIPAEVSHIQWLDMSAWREKLSEGEGSFGPWFDESMSELVRVVESGNSARFSGDIAKISECLGGGLDLDASKQTYLLSKPFIGRAQLMERVAEWLDDRLAPRVCLVTGDVGVGKSAFAARLAHWSWRLCGRVAASFFCEYGRDRHNDPSVVVQTLAYLLACRIPQYRALLRIVLDRGPDLGTMGADDLFVLLIAEPLSHAFDADHECMLIVVDGVDEAGGVGRNRLARALARYAGRLPAWMKVLVTSRRVSATTAPFGTGVFRIDISGSDEANMTDVRDYLSASLMPSFGGEPGFDEAVGSIAETSGGVFLYATLMVDAATKSNVGLDALASTCPAGLHEQVLQWFEWTFPDVGEYRAVFRDALGCVAVAPGGWLPLGEFSVLFGWGENETNDFLRRVEVFVRRGDDPLSGSSVTVSHFFLVEWLTGEHSGEYRSAPRDATRLMARSYYEVASRDADLLTDYEAVNVLELMETSGLMTRLGELLRGCSVARRIIAIAERLGEGGRDSMACDILLRLRKIDDRHGGSPRSVRAELLHTLGIFLSEAGRPSQAEKAYREAIGIYGDLAASESSALSAMADSLSNLGALLIESNRPDQAERPLRKALHIYRRIEVFDNSLVFREADNLNRLGLAFMNSGRPEEAEAALRESVLYFRGLTQLHPFARPFLAASLTNLGNLFRTVGKVSGAERALREALSIWRDLAVSDPNGLRQMASCLLNLGVLLVGRGKLTDAEKAYREALDIYQDLAASEPARRRDVADVLNNLGILHQDAGRLDKAEEAYKEALKIYRDLAASEPVLLRDLAVVLGNLGIPLRDAGRLDEAEEAYKEALEIWRGLAVSDSVGLRSRADALNNFGATLCDSGRAIEAEQSIREALDVFRRLSVSFPATYRDVADSLLNLGVLLRCTGRLDEAEKAFQEALDIYRDLAASEPARRRDVALVLSKRGILLRDEGRNDEAIDALRESLIIYRSFSEEGLRRSTHELAIVLRAYGMVAGDLASEEMSIEALRLSDELERGLPDLGGFLDGIDRLIAGNLA